MAKKHIQLLKKHHHVNYTGKLTTEKLDAFVKKYFDHDALIEHGRQALVEDLRNKKIQKMTRKLGGEEHYTEVVNAVNRLNGHSTEHEIGAVQKIVLDKIKTHQFSRNIRLTVYGLGALVSGLSFVFTAGIGPLVLAICSSVIALLESGISAKDASHLKQDITKPPGHYDQLAPTLGIILGVGGIVAAFVVANIFGFGLPAIIAGVIAAALWISQNIYQMHCIAKRKENYMEALLAKPTITIQELDYLSRHLPTKTLEKHMGEPSLLDKLSADDRQSLTPHINSANFAALKNREKLKRAIQSHYFDLERTIVKNAWDTNQRHLSAADWGNLEISIP
ncbi:MAG: hypothetical protein KGZ39_02145 [Simkania sp.]|nr:hypothetical protein [Simkania sp.]